MSQSCLEILSFFAMSIGRPMQAAMSDRMAQQ